MTRHLAHVTTFAVDSLLLAAAAPLHAVPPPTTAMAWDDARHLGPTLTRHPQVHREGACPVRGSDHIGARSL